MVEKMTVIIDSAECKLPRLDQSIHCPKHPLLVPEISYGLAGGGIGLYSYCCECGTILSKDPEEGEE